jgi:predicted ATPase
VAIETTSTLLERDRELAALGDALTGAEAGRGHVVLVEAPAGIGKTSLLRAAADRAARAGFTVPRARASELERDWSGVWSAVRAEG